MTLEEAWNELHEATPLGWYVGRPTYNSRRDEWSLYCFDTTETAHIGQRSREWTAVAKPHFPHPRARTRARVLNLWNEHQPSVTTALPARRRAG